MEKYTIKDIAKLAGVSKGTVDRVIHKRGKVSKSAFEKVNTILEKIDYKPNLLARSLKNTKNYRICVVLPTYHKDSFWLPCKNAIDEAITEFSPFGISIEPFYFKSNDISSFIDVNNQVLALKPDAVLLAPLFYRETVKIAANYISQNIIVSKFNNQLEIENTNNFVGQDLFKSGRLAASLFQMITPKNSTIAIIHIDEDYENATHIQEKEKGFRDYFKNIKEYKLKTYNSKKGELNNALTSIFKDPININAIFVTTSKIYRVANFINNNNIQNVKLIGYDLLEKNINHLKNHTINFLIHQNPKKQVYLGLTYLVDHFLFNKEIPAKSLLPLDVITSENLDTYINN